MTEQELQDVKNYYTLTAVDYKNLWTGSEDLAMHFGYYDETVKNHKDSLLKMNEVLSKIVGVTKNDLVLDAGCGYGGSAIWLAKNIGCRVIGLNVVDFQLQEASAAVIKQGLFDKVFFYKKDYTKTDFPNNYFDVVWALESVVHSFKKEDFIKESYRILKKGGKIFITEFMLKDKYVFSDKQRYLLDKWLKGWAMAELLTPSRYQTLLKKAGFKKIEIYYLTKNITPSSRRLFKMSSFAFPFVRFIYKIGFVNEKRFLNVEASLAQGILLKEKAWLYTAIKAQKP